MTSRWMTIGGHLRAFCLAVAMAAASASLCAAEEARTARGAFVQARGTGFVLDGKPFPVAGANNHYLSYGSASEVVRVLDDAVAMRVNVLRTFNHPVIGSSDDFPSTIWKFRTRADSSNLGVHGVYMMYWDAANRRMAFNDGPNGMERLDFLIAEAGKRGLKLIIPFLDFWAYTGGAQQMRAWYGSEDKNSFFFNDSRTRADFKAWVRHVLTRINTRTGVAYKDDPTIMAWELMNEPNAASDEMFLTWVAEMAAFVKSIDAGHLLGSGHSNVTNRISDAKVPGIDFLTWHGYPLYYNLTVDAFNQKIGEFCAIGHENGKPVLLEEFGFSRSNPNQAAAYRMWLDTIRNNKDCAGWLVWRLVSRQDHGQYPVDKHDRFDVHRESGQVWDVLTAEAIELRTSRGDEP